MPASSASCAGVALLLAHGPDALEHRGRPARVHDRVGIALELGGEQLRDQSVVAAASRRRSPRAGRAAARRPRRARRRGSRAARSRRSRPSHRWPPPGRRPWRTRRRACPAGSRAARCRCRRRRAARGARLRGAVKPCPSGPSAHSASPGRSSDSRRVPGPTSSSRKCDSPSRWRAMENARGRCGRSCSPAPQRSTAASIANWPASGFGPSGSAARRRL